MSALETVELLGNYRIEQRLGINGSSATLFGISTSEGIRVAIVAVDGSKVVNPDLWAEVDRNLQTLSKANTRGRVAKPMTWGYESGLYWVAYPWLTGSHLGGVVQADGLPPISRSFQIAGRIVESIQVLAELNIPHLCISPASIFIRQDGEVLLLHAGWSRMLLGLTDGPAHSELMSNLPFLAPEVAGRNSGADFSADIYSVAANLYFLLSGHPTHWADDPVNLASTIANVSPSMEMLREYVDADALELLDEMLEMDPEERPVNLAALRDRLEATSIRLYEGESDVRAAQMAAADPVLPDEPTDQGLAHEDHGQDSTPRPHSAMDAAPEDTSSQRRNALQSAVAEGLARHAAGESLTSIPRTTIPLSPPPAPVTAEVSSGPSKMLLILIAVGGLVFFGAVAWAALILIGGSSPQAPAETASRSTSTETGGRSAANRAAANEGYVVTQERLRLVGEKMRAYRREYGIWPRSINDLKFEEGEEREIIQDAWGTDFDLRSSYAVSAGADRRWDSDDEIWINVENREIGGRLPSAPSPSPAPSNGGGSTE